MVLQIIIGVSLNSLRTLPTPPSSASLVPVSGAGGVAGLSEDGVVLGRPDLHEPGVRER